MSREIKYTEPLVGRFIRLAESGKAFYVEFTTPEGGKIRKWIPFSQIVDEYNNSVKYDDKEYKDEIVFKLATWLAEKEGLDRFSREAQLDKEYGEGEEEGAWGDDKAPF